jgi:hypothetical protein
VTRARRPVPDRGGQFSVTLGVLATDAVGTVSPDIAEETNSLPARYFTDPAV